MEVAWNNKVWITVKPKLQKKKKQHEIELIICIKKDLTWNNQEILMCHKTQRKIYFYNPPSNLWSDIFSIFLRAKNKNKLIQKNYIA